MFQGVFEDSNEMGAPGARRQNNAFERALFCHSKMILSRTISNLESSLMLRFLMNQKLYAAGEELKGTLRVEIVSYDTSSSLKLQELSVSLIGNEGLFLHCKF
jgi:hypothetical protein